MKPLKAFTLVELLVVIAIISILAGMLLPALEEAIDSARKISCQNNQRQVYMAATYYASDFDGRLPGYGQLDGGPFIGRNQGNILYWINTYLDMKMVNISGVELQPSDYTLTGNIVGGFADGYGKGEAIRGLLECPTSILAENKADAYQMSDYWLNGFGAPGSESGLPTPSGYTTNGYTFIHDYPKLAKVGTPEKGSPKVMLMDNLYLAPLFDNRDFMYKYATNHNPGDPRGMNVIAGDGSGAWVTAANCYAVSSNSANGDIAIGYENRAGPMGYYTQSQGTGNVGYTSLTSLRIREPDGSTSNTLANRSLYY